MNSLKIFCPHDGCDHAFIFKFSQWNIPLLWTAYHEFRREYIDHMEACRRQILIRAGLNEAGLFYMGEAV